MHTSTTLGRWLMAVVFLLGMTGSAHAQRIVTLVLNTASTADTTSTMDFIEVRGAADPDGNGFQAPYTINALGDIIDWSDASTLEPVNIGGDYWAITGPVTDTISVMFKFFSQETQDGAIGEGWEVDPNPILEPGTNDTTLTVHFFETQREYRGNSGDKGEYDWRPYRVPGGDSVAVWFRVFVNTESAIGRYNRVDDDVMKVAGDGLGGFGPMDWNNNSKVVLSREATDKTKPGYDLFSGVGYYPASTVGMEQPYKFIIDNAAGTEWEGNIDNRTFTVPAQDTTLHWVYFDNSPPATEQPVTAFVTFNVDLTPLETIGVFDLGRGDSLEVKGQFNGWGCTEATPFERCLLEKIPGEVTYEGYIDVTALPETIMPYKYFLAFNIPEAQAEFGVDIIPSGWEEPYTTGGGDRKFTFGGDPDNDQFLDVVRFNDIGEYSIMNDGEGTDVTFRVDMSPALNMADPFDAATDTVIVAFADPFFSMTQGFPLTARSDNPNLGDALNLTSYARNHFVLTDEDEDMVYEGTLSVGGPTYAALQYKYAYGDGGGWTEEFGGDTATGGRRRQRFVLKNPDGSWPPEFTVYNDRNGGDTGPEVFKDEAGVLPGDPNPAFGTAIEQVGGEVPSRVTLDQNYPNPFNPSTAFSYTLDRTMDVNVRVYDILGRVVATLVDGVQQAATYRVTFDGAHLASGTYMYRLETPGKVITRQMILIK